MIILRKKKYLAIALSIIVVLMAVYCTIGFGAKYVSNDDLYSSVQVSLLLQGDEADLYESPISLQTDGSYELKKIDTKEDATGTSTSVRPSRLNEYEYVLPGVNIPKNPKLFVTKKSGAPAYLYLEVIEENFPVNYTNNGFVSINENNTSTNTNRTDAVYYDLEDYWTPVYKSDGTTQMVGKNGGKLYVYYNTGDTGLTSYNNPKDKDGKEIKVSYLASYIMDDTKNGKINNEKYYGVNEVRKDANGNEVSVPYFNIIKNGTIYVSEKYIHYEYYSTLNPATLGPNAGKYSDNNFGLYFYGYMASAKQNGNFITPAAAYDLADFMNEEDYLNSLG